MNLQKENELSAQWNSSPHIICKINKHKLIGRSKVSEFPPLDGIIFPQNEIFLLFSKLFNESPKKKMNYQPNEILHHKWIAI
jgi:hypothetical protein